MRACECRIGEPLSSRESAKYDRSQCEGYIFAFASVFSPRHSSNKFGSALGLSKTLAYLANLLSLISPPAPRLLPSNGRGVL